MCEKQLNYLTTPQGMLTCFLMTYWRTYKKELKTKYDEKKDTVAQSQILAFAPFLTQKIFHGQCKNPYLKSVAQLSLCFVFLNFSRSRCIISHFLCFAKVQTKGEKKVINFVDLFNLSLAFTIQHQDQQNQKLYPKQLSWCIYLSKNFKK